MRASDRSAASMSAAARPPAGLRCEAGCPTPTASGTVAPPAPPGCPGALWLAGTPGYP